MSAATVSPAPVAHRPTLVPKGRKSLRALVEADMARLNALGESPRSSPPRKNQPLSDAEIKRRTRPHVPFEIRPDKRKLVEMFRDEGHFCLPYKVPKTDHTPTSTGTTTTSSSPVSETSVKAQLGKPAGRESQVKPKPGRVFGDRPRRVSMREVLLSQKSSTKPQSDEPKRIRVKARPASWFFNIYIDDEVEEATNLMQHSTDRLEISDAEGKAGFDDHDKENIPPHELGISLPGPAQPATAASRKNMTAQFRSPLGDLDAADYDGRSPSDLTDDILREHEYVKRGIAMFGTLISPEIPSCMSVSASY